MRLERRLDAADVERLELGVEVSNEGLHGLDCGFLM